MGSLERPCKAGAGPDIKGRVVAVGGQERELETSKESVSPNAIFTFPWPTELHHKSVCFISSFTGFPSCVTRLGCFLVCKGTSPLLGQLERKCVCWKERGCVARE